MKVLRLSAVVVCLLALAPPLEANDKTPASITVAFGAGMNTNIPGFTPNHHIIPQEFKVKITKAQRLNGEEVIVPATVNFIVNGFHWMWVYKSGVELADVVVPASGTFVNYEVITGEVSNVFWKGVFPGTPPTFTNADPFPRGATQNRAESVGFSTPGKYLVMCNVRGHFLDGMWAIVHVIGADEEEEG